MRVFVLITALLSAACFAQSGSPAEISAGAQLPAGSSVRRIELRLNAAPQPRDRLIITVSTDAIGTVLITPEGTRITEGNAESSGLSWGDVPLQPAIGSTDGGHSSLIQFQRPGRAGLYVIELTAKSLPQPATANAAFIPNKQDYAAAMRRIPGFVTVGPVAISKNNPSATLDLTVANDEAGSILDLVITDAAAKVRITLPNGRTIDSQHLPPDTKWETVSKASELDAAGSPITLSGLLLHRDGTHHVVLFQKLPRGVYRAHAETSNAGPVEFTAAVIPVERIFTDAAASVNHPPATTPPGGVQLQPRALPNDAYAGDKLELVVGFAGEAVSPGVHFRVRLEYREIHPAAHGQPGDLGPPVVEEKPVDFIRGTDGRYRASVTPSRPGLVRVGLQANGTTTKGIAFSDEIVLGSVNVHRVVARFVAVTENAVDVDHDGAFDQLDITASLDVMLAGEFELRLSVGGENAHSIYTSTRQSLRPGRQSLTVAIPAARIRKELDDGPWTISQIQIFRPVTDTASDFVDTKGLSVRTRPYRRDQWSRGAISSQERVTARGIHPSASGKFRMLEVLLKVTSPGGRCGWLGTLTTSGVQPLHILTNGILPRGTVNLSFVFDGSAIAAASQPKWFFSPILNCDSGNLTDDRRQPLMDVSVDPSQFELSKAPFRVSSQVMLQLQPGASSTAVIDVTDRKPDEISVRPGAAPAGITIAPPQSIRSGPYGAQFMVRVQAAPDVKAGRYFVPIQVVAGASNSAADLVVDILPH